MVMNWEQNFDDFSSYVYDSSYIRGQWPREKTAEKVSQELVDACCRFVASQISLLYHIFCNCVLLFLSCFWGLGFQESCSFCSIALHSVYSCLSSCSF